MVTDLVTFKIENSFLKDIDTILKKAHYHSRTEFIRTALREKVTEEKLKALIGSAKPLTDKQKKARSAELKNKDPSYILRKYGLD